MSEEIRSIIVERNVEAVMRDGTVLRANIYRPSTSSKYPVLLQRNPYSKDYYPFAAATMDPVKAAYAGYVIIIQDVRGRFESEGGPYYLCRDEFNDGYDSVEWAASLPFADGNVGMFGGSYMGMTQFQAAVMQPPHLKAIFPVTWGTDIYFYQGGAFELGLLSWWCLKLGINALARAKAGQPDFFKEFFELIQTLDNIEETAYRHLPLRDAPWQKIANGFAPFYADILNHDTFDQFHKSISVNEKCHNINVPAFCMAGWFDPLLRQNLQTFRNLKDNGGSQIAKEKTRLLIGPWIHGNFSNSCGELDFGIASSELLLELKRDFTTIHLQWFDYWLKGINNGIAEEAPLKIFVMGENKWRDEKEWPLARTVYTPYYLHSNGCANTLYGDGHLSTTEPLDEKTDSFIYDPANPVPTCGGSILLPMHYIRGPLNQSLLETREDILVYTSEPLEQNIETTGPVKIILYAASSAPDTDFTGKMVDVYPDGRAIIITDGIIRASCRNHAEMPSSIKPGEVYKYEIDLGSTSYLFKKGHKLRVEISSSNFPRYDRNTNTGIPGRDSAAMLPAKQTIFHNQSYPSAIILPIIPS